MIKTIYEIDNGRQFSNLDEARNYIDVLNNVIFFDVATVIGDKVILEEHSINSKDEYVVEACYESAVAIYIPYSPYGLYLNKIIDSACDNGIYSAFERDIKVPDDAYGIYYCLSDENCDNIHWESIRTLIDDPERGRQFILLRNEIEKFLFWRTKKEIMSY